MTFKTIKRIQLLLCPETSTGFWPHSEYNPTFWPWPRVFPMICMSLPPHLQGFISLQLLASLLFLKTPSTPLHLDLGICCFLYLKPLFPDSHTFPLPHLLQVLAQISPSNELKSGPAPWHCKFSSPTGTTDISLGFICLQSTHNYPASTYLFPLYRCYLMLLKVVYIWPEYRLYLLTSKYSHAELKQRTYSV